MGTLLQILYTRFQTKIDEDIAGKEGLIFSLVDVAIAKSYKTCRHSLNYVLDEPIYDEEENITNLYEGSFDDILDSDEIELLALWMLYEWNRREQQRLIKLKRDIGTSDFNRLEGKKEQLQSVNSSMKITKEDITDLVNDFNTYKYS